MELVHKSFVTMVIKPQLFMYLRLVLTILTKYHPLGEDSNPKFPFFLQHLPQVCQVGHTIDRCITPCRYISTGTRGELCGCCDSEACSWQNCLWCCCRRGPRAEKNPAGEVITSRGKLDYFFQGQVTSKNTWLKYRAQVHGYCSF